MKWTKYFGYWERQISVWFGVGFVYEKWVQCLQAVKYTCLTYKNQVRKKKKFKKKKVTRLVLMVMN